MRVAERRAGWKVAASQVGDQKMEEVAEGAVLVAEVKQMCCSRVEVVVGVEAGG